ncbi:hypothetical protein AB0N93_31595 [Streptomyces sp. NPDC091267]|uniref:hypothetical protein n=1 Tax=unclassified Streptomyces TaxID=2593676 RepID=UPI003414B214
MATSDAEPCEFCDSPVGHGDVRDWSMPLTFAPAFLTRLGGRLWECVPAGAPAHLVVLATGGVGMGVAAALTAPDGRLGSVSVVKRAFDFDSPQLAPAPGEPVVVLDNSLHSGRSVEAAVKHMTARGVTPSIVLTVFDAAHDCERRARERVARDTGVPVSSLAPWADRHAWV